MTKGSRGITAISLFCGAGGLDYALCDSSKVRALMSSDSNSIFLATVDRNIRAHFPRIRHKTLLEDARALVGERLKEHAPGQIDLIIGGPPCDDFTNVGMKRGQCGPKASLVFEFCRLVGELRPRAFLFENVPNLVRQFSALFADLTAQLQTDHGYCITHRLLKAADFGSPTQRERVFVVGFSQQSALKAFRFPAPTHGEADRQLALLQLGHDLRPPVHVADVLGDIPNVDDASGRAFLNHDARIHRPATLAAFRTLAPGIASKQSYRYRAPWQGLCRSLTAGMDDSTKAYIHPRYDREMTVREYARIHGFPDTWFFEGSRDNGIKQVANSVPIPLGKAVLQSLVAVL